jgi:glycosyltransferase involved in cell wall biosynthesis
VRFVGYQHARDAFAMGRILVIPSRAESLPYVALEAAAAGLPIIASHVGGVPEIFGPQSGCLVAPENVDALADAIARALDRPDELKHVTKLVRGRIRDEFSVAAMVDNGLVAYREAIALRKLARFA